MKFHIPLICYICFILLSLQLSGCDTYYVKTIEVPGNAQRPFVARCDEYNIDVMILATGEMQIVTQNHPILSTTKQCAHEDVDVVPGVLINWSIDHSDTRPTLKNNYAAITCETFSGTILELTKVRLLCWKHKLE